MKKLICLIFIIYNSYPIFSQDWIKYFGYGQQPHSAYCIEQYDKGYILLGNINNYKYGWIVKTDINGNKLWDIKIGDGINETMPANIEQTQDNGFILCGTTSIYNSPHSDPFIMKLNSCGDLEWCKVLIYDNANDGGISIKQTTDGGYVFCCILYGNIPNNIIHLFKFDRGGELFWHKIYNRDSIMNSEAIEKMYIDESNILLTGFCYYPNWIIPYYIQTDTSGNETWRLVYSEHTGLGFVGEGWASVRDTHGNYYSAGRREGSPNLIKFSGDGIEMMDTDLFPGAQGGNALTIQFNNDTSLIIGAGWTMNGTDGELAMLKTDTLGNIIKLKNLPNPNNSGMTWSTITYDNKILVIGTDYNAANSRIELFKFNSDLEYDSVYTQHFKYDSLCPDTVVSHTFIPNCDVVVGLQEPLTNAETAALKVFPNPTNQEITLEFPKYILVKTGKPGFGSTTVYHHWKSTTLEVYEISGKKLFEKEIVRAQRSLEIDVSKWPSGMYYLRLVYNNQTVADVKVVVE